MTSQVAQALDRFLEAAEPQTTRAALDLLERLEARVLAQGLIGQVFTPPPVARWLAAAASVERLKGVCLDPAAGTGRLLLAALDARCAAGADPIEVVERDLIGIERDPLAAAVCRAALIARAMALGATRPPHPTVLDGDAFGALPQASAILMNPPFGNADALPADFHDQAKARWGFHRKQVDRSVFFIAAGLEALEEGGRMAAIVPRYWLEATGAAPFRAWLSARASIEQIIDMGNVQVWQEAEVLTALVVLGVGGKRRSTTRFFRLSDRNEKTALWSAPGQAPQAAWEISAARLDQAPWSFRAPAEEARIEALCQGSERLGDWFRVGQGMKTGLNAVFVLDEAEARRHRLPEALLKATIKARDVRAFRVTDRGQVLLRVLNGTDLGEYPDLERYLKPHREALERRYQAVRGTCAWYALSLPQNLSMMDKVPRIVAPLYARDNRFAIDRVGYDLGTDIYMMVPSRPLPVPLEAIVALLNSAPLRDFVRARAKLKRAGYMEFGARLLRALPLPLCRDSGLWGELAEAALALERAEGQADALREHIDLAAQKLFETERGRG